MKKVFTAILSLAILSLASVGSAHNNSPSHYQCDDSSGYNVNCGWDDSGNLSSSSGYHYASTDSIDDNSHYGRWYVTTGDSFWAGQQMDIEVYVPNVTWRLNPSQRFYWDGSLITSYDMNASKGAWLPLTWKYLDGFQTYRLSADNFRPFPDGSSIWDLSHFTD